MTNEDRGAVGVLLSPSQALVVDIFRALGDFEISYDVSIIDVLERRLAGACDPATARAIVSDALLFGFSIRNARTDASWPHGDWTLGPIGARQATEHECATLCLVAACGRAADDPAEAARDRALAAQAATRLGVRLNRTVAALARDLAGRLARAGIGVDRPDWRALMAARIESARAAPAAAKAPTWMQS